MASSMKAVTETGIELSNEERNLLSVAYKVRIFLSTKQQHIIPHVLILECCWCKKKLLESNIKY